MESPLRQIGTTIHVVLVGKRVFAGHVVRPAGPVQMLACKDHGFCTCPLMEQWFQRQSYMLALCLGAARALLPGRTLGFAGKPIGEDGFFPFSRIVENRGEDSPAVAGIAITDYDLTSFEAAEHYAALTDAHEEMRGPENEVIAGLVAEVRKLGRTPSSDDGW